MLIATHRGLGDEGEGSAGPTCPGCAADAVNVRRGNGDIITYHVVNVRNVQPSCHGIAGHQSEINMPRVIQSVVGEVPLFIFSSEKRCTAMASLFSQSYNISSLVQRHKNHG